MDPSKLRKRQIARRLGVSEQILEQYLQLKRAEVLQPKPAGPETLEPDAIPTVFRRASATSDRAPDGTRTRPSQGSMQHPEGSTGPVRRGD